MPNEMSRRQRRFFQARFFVTTLVGTGDPDIFYTPGTTWNPQQDHLFKEARSARVQDLRSMIPDQCFLIR